MNIEQKQHLLAFLGVYTGSVDGIWGPKSQTAMNLVREKYGVDDDIVALMEAVADWVPNNGTSSGNNGTFWDAIKYFDRGEAFIACPCGNCGGFPVEPVERLMRNADATREHFGRPMIPTSTVRCVAHNASLKDSAANSLHMRGKAMDFGIPGVSAATIVNYVRTLPEVHECYAIDESHVHMGVQKY